MTQISGHVVIDDRGVPLIEGTRMKVATIAMEKNRGATPEQIQSSFPHLSLAHIYSALAYYYDNRASMDAAISASLQSAESLREASIAAGNQPSREALAKRLNKSGSDS